jgi:hypothetical protein
MKLLKQYDVDTIFGIPGVHTIEYYRGITESGIKGVVPATNKAQDLWQMDMRVFQENQVSAY